MLQYCVCKFQKSVPLLAMRPVKVDTDYCWPVLCFGNQASCYCDYRLPQATPTSTVDLILMPPPSCRTIKVWDFQAALDPQSQADTLCLQTLEVGVTLVNGKH